jgi:hypothetical protein
MDGARRSRTSAWLNRGYRVQISLLPSSNLNIKSCLRRSFDADNPQWPDTVELSLTMPPGLQERYAEEEVRNAVSQELARQEQLAHQEVKKRNWRVLGAERVRRLSPYRRATSFELLRDRNPTFAVGRAQRRVFFNAVAELRAFRRAYRQALEQWRAGMRDAVFPHGTWGMCQVHGVVVRT